MEQLQALYNQLSSNPMGFVTLYFWDLLVGAICIILLYSFSNPDNKVKKKRNWIGIIITSVAYPIFFLFRHNPGFNIIFSNIEISWLKVIFVIIMIIFSTIYSKNLSKREWIDSKIRIQSLVSFYTTMFSIIVIVLFGYYWMIFIIPITYCIACIYIVPIRRRWVVTMFEKPFFVDWVCMYKNKKFVINSDIVSEIDNNGSLFLDNGLNILLLASWLPGFDIIPLDYIRKEERFKTEQLPTNDPGNVLAGGTLSIDYKVWFKLNYWPKTFLKLDDDDRNDLKNVIKRIIDGHIADRLAGINGLNEAMTMDSYGLDDGIMSGGKRKINSIISPSLFIKIKKEVFRHTGSLLMDITIMDRNPDKLIEEEQNKLTATKTQIEEAKLQEELQGALGRAEGAKVVEAIKALQDGVGIDKSEALSLFAILKTMESDGKMIIPAGLLDRLGSVLKT